MNDLRPADVALLADVLATVAMSEAEPDAYLRDLVLNRAGLPRRWQLAVAGMRFTNLGIAARQLLRWADDKGVNPEDPRYTTVASLVLPLLDDVGPDRGADIVAVLVARRLVRDRGERDRIVACYQVPSALRGDEAAFAVPTLAVDAVELQGFRARAPDILDVGFLSSAVQAAACVCRVETRAGTPVGTGFLVAEDLVLTCRHVVAEAGTPLLRLRFRHTSLSSGTVVDVDPADPMPRHSDVLDLAALRLCGPPPADTGVRAYGIGGAPVPAAQDALAVLQHPGGDVLKLAATQNAVTQVRTDVVRYVSTTAGGSSGAPCFDDKWRIVAMHRAERATMIGAVREGLLAARIHQEIADLL